MEPGRGMARGTSEAAFLSRDTRRRLAAWKESTDGMLKAGGEMARVLRSSPSEKTGSSFSDESELSLHVVVRIPAAFVQHVELQMTTRKVVRPGPC